MTDMVGGMSQGSESSVPQAAPVASAPAPSAPSQSHEEKMLRQSEVNEIVRKAKYGAVEDYKRLQTEQPQYVQQKYGESYAPQQQQQQPYQQSMQGLSPDDMRRVAAEEIQRSRDEWAQQAQRTSQEQEAQRVAGEFFNKLSLGKDKYQDFENVVGDIEFVEFPLAIQLATSVENTADVMYEFGRDPSKMLNLEQLAGKSPKAALKLIQKLSQSIKDNESVTKMRVPSEPLSQLRPSNTGTDSPGMSVRDARNKYRG